MKLLPVIVLPNVSVLEKPTGPLYHYDLKTKGDLARLMRYLFFTCGMLLSLKGSGEDEVESEAVFKAGDSFYRIEVEANTFHNNPFAVSYVTLYELKSEYLDSLVNWSRAEGVSYKKVTGFSGLITEDGSETECPAFTEYGFNDLWAPLTGGPIGYQHSLAGVQHLRELLPTANTCLNWLEEKEAFKGVLDKLTVEGDLHARLAEADTLY